MAKQIYAGNLNYQMSEDSLKELFAPLGEVSSTKIIRDRHTGRSKGFGFIEMLNDEEADSAVAQLNGTEVDGRSIRVDLAKPRREDST